MLIPNEAIETFRKGDLEIDCYRMTLIQEKADGEHFEGNGYIRQTDDGSLAFKIYVTSHNGAPMQHIAAQMAKAPGKMIPDDAYYLLKATAYDGTDWTGTRMLPRIHWGANDDIVLIEGSLQSIIAHLTMPQRQHVLNLHFFEEFDIPCTLMSKIEDHGAINYNRDRAEFNVDGAAFEIRKHTHGETTVEIASDDPLPASFDLRVQEALQFIIARPAFWRARLQSHDQELHLELASPWRKSPRTQFSTPISSVSLKYMEYGWCLFSAFLTYVTSKTQGTHWNPVAYHLHGAYEATANSINARAVGLCVAVEAVASLIKIEGDGTQDKEVKEFQTSIRSWLEAQTELPASIAKRAKGLIGTMGTKRPQDILHALALKGLVEKDYIDAWSDLRNRHVHPKLKDLAKPAPTQMQPLFDKILRVEVLLHQMTFHLIGYQGCFTDYGALGFPIREYPLLVPRNSIDQHRDTAKPENLTRRVSPLSSGSSDATAAGQPE
ncbi:MULTISPECIES: hypothetical protein [Novosphingobium]|uniref:ApeA N-terminal domain-containing protein n=1 Tax=Novosphingobium sediminicola TaxID=563162 RepID=A0A7W6G7H0_9SPHN|nr:MULTISPECIES: hypothetical protein [Novosphingobium]MBB3956306.1 hypothetical protein [Novosphingobium sediminicola]MDR6709907.1 hypothetical protein [Novosphingobium sp. 1748]